MKPFHPSFNVADLTDVHAGPAMFSDVIPYLYSNDGKAEFSPLREWQGSLVVIDGRRTHEGVGGVSTGHRPLFLSPVTFDRYVTAKVGTNNLTYATGVGFACTFRDLFKNWGVGMQLSGFPWVDVTTTPFANT